MWVPEHSVPKGLKSVSDFRIGDFAATCSNEFGLETQNAQHENKACRPNSRYRQVVALAGLHVVSRDFPDEFHVFVHIFLVHVFV